MELSRRKFLTRASLGMACLAGTRPSESLGSIADQAVPRRENNAYKYRVAFGCWINDMRNDPLPLENWPAPQVDDEAIRSAIAALDVQSAAGFNYLDVWGLFATTGYPPDVTSAFADPDRRRRVRELIKAATDREIKVIFGMGLMSWGFDQIINADPTVRGKTVSGQPAAHAMCGASEKAWAYVQKVLDCALAEFDFGGVHLESADMGWCQCPQCAGKYGTVGYNIRLNIRAADYIKKNWPERIVTTIVINWLNDTGRRYFNEDDKTQIVELSKHIDCFMDQGHRGTYLADAQRKEFIPKLHCPYGTSGGVFLYPDARWDRSSYFLPYAKRTGNAIKQHYEGGVRGSMFYQGPVSNPSTEINIAVGGRILANTVRSVDDALAESLELYYKPKSGVALKKLMNIFLRAEDSYCGQWDPAAFEALRGKNSSWAGPPGEFELDEHLFGHSPGPATYLLEPCLNAAGREACKNGLISILRDLPAIENAFDDHGRIDKIRRGIIITLNFLNTISQCKGERK
jgi:hypothetical protein